MFKAFMDAKAMNPEDVKKQCEASGFKIPHHFFKNFCGGMSEGNHGSWGEKHGWWKSKRAILWTKSDETVHEIAPGQTIFPEVWIQNGTHWPWKQGCFLGMDDTKEGEKECALLPVEMINMPISFAVAGQQKFQLAVPLKVHDHFVADGEVHEVNLSFRGPHGNTFGQRITFKVRVSGPSEQIDEMTLYQLALKLHNDLKLGSFDDCVSAARAANCDEAATVVLLQARSQQTEQ